MKQLPDEWKYIRDDQRSESTDSTHLAFYSKHRPTDSPRIAEMLSNINLTGLEDFKVDTEKFGVIAPVEALTVENLDTLKSKITWARYFTKESRVFDMQQKRHGPKFVEHLAYYELSEKASEIIWKDTVDNFVDWEAGIPLLSRKQLGRIAKLIEVFRANRGLTL